MVGAQTGELPVVGAVIVNTTPMKAAIATIVYGIQYMVNGIWWARAARAAIYSSYRVRGYFDARICQGHGIVRQEGRLPLWP